VTEIFPKFPRLKRLSLRECGFPVAESTTTKIDMNKIAKIQYFESSDLPRRVEYLENVQEIVLHVDDIDVIDTLIRYLPKLNALEKLDLRYGSLYEDLFEYEEEDPDGIKDYLEQLIEAISANPLSLWNLKISADHWQRDRQDSIHDLTMIKLLNRLPERITFIEYKEYKVRH
jgi:hypothetical protein